MTPMENPAARPPDAFEKQLTLLNSNSWEQEIDEVLRSAREAPRTRAADPDWQAARYFLVRHCREALHGRR